MRIRSAGQLVVAAALTAGALTGVSPAGAAPTSSGVTAEAKARCTARRSTRARSSGVPAYFLLDPMRRHRYWTVMLRATGRLSWISVLTISVVPDALQQLTTGVRPPRYTNHDRSRTAASTRDWLLETRQLTRGLVMLSFSESPEFRERVGVWPGPPAAGDPQILPQYVPLTMHPGRTNESSGSVEDYRWLNYHYPDTVSMEEIFGYTIGQLQCGGWQVFAYDDQPDEDGMYIGCREASLILDSPVPCGSEGGYSALPASVLEPRSPTSQHQQRSPPPPTVGGALRPGPFR